MALSQPYLVALLFGCSYVLTPSRSRMLQTTKQITTNPPAPRGQWLNANNRTVDTNIMHHYVNLAVVSYEVLVSPNYTI